jgi:hypothetical protein
MAFDPDAFLASNAAPAAFDPDAFLASNAAPQSGMPGPRRGNFFSGVGRGLASVADATLGSALPAVAQQIGYPLARLGRSPEEAQAATQRVVGAIDKPFGKAFGVADTPEYQEESGRQLLDFIGQNIQKSAAWISQATGVPVSDVENVMGSATLAAPAAAAPVGRAVKQAVAPVIEQATAGIKMPFEKQLQARGERMSLADYARGPQIDAAGEAKRLKLVINPTDIESTVGTRLYSAAAGPKGPEALVAANKPRIREIALNDMDLPPTSQLDGAAAFRQAREKVAGPYNEVRSLPIQKADASVVAALEDLRPAKSLIGKEATATYINKLVDDAVGKTQGGLTGAELVDNIASLRKDAQRTYKNQNATPAQLDLADANLAISSQLESMIDANITNPKLLEKWKTARQKMARTYSYEGATDFNTGIVDVKKLARITAKDNALTGDIASLGKIAGNFPDAFSVAAATPWYSAPRFSRSGGLGAAGALVGSQFGGYTGLAIGGALGALAGEVGSSMAANRLASPGYQAGLRLRDARIPVSQLATVNSLRPTSAEIKNALAK